MNYNISIASLAMLALKFRILPNTSNSILLRRKVSNTSMDTQIGQ